MRILALSCPSFSEPDEDFRLQMRPLVGKYPGAFAVFLSHPVKDVDFTVLIVMRKIVHCSIERGL